MTEKSFIFFEQLAHEQIAHMNTEETVIFPYIKSLYENHKELENAKFGSLRSPVSIMEMEHENTEGLLNHICSLTNNFKPQESDSSLVGSFLKDMELLQRDIELHVYKEDNILYPKAIQWETEYYQERT